MDEEFHTAEDVARLLKVSIETVRRWLRSGDLRGFQYGSRGAYRISSSDLKQFIESRKPAA